MLPPDFGATLAYRWAKKIPCSDFKALLLKDVSIVKFFELKIFVKKMVPHRVLMVQKGDHWAKVTFQEVKRKLKNWNCLKITVFGVFLAYFYKNGLFPCRFSIDI